jgi:hypothetical protein
MTEHHLTVAVVCFERRLWNVETVPYVGGDAEDEDPKRREYDDDSGYEKEHPDGLRDSAVGGFFGYPCHDFRVDDAC